MGSSEDPEKSTTTCGGWSWSQKQRLYVYLPRLLQNLDWILQSTSLRLNAAWIGL